MRKILSVKARLQGEKRSKVGHLARLFNAADAFSGAKYTRKSKCQDTLALFGRPFRRRGGGGDGERVQFVAGQFIRQAVFNQAVARQPGFALEGARHDVGEKVVAVALYFDVFTRRHGGNHLFDFFGGKHNFLSTMVQTASTAPRIIVHIIQILPAESCNNILYNRSHFISDGLFVRTTGRLKPTHRAQS